MSVETSTRGRWPLSAPPGRPVGAGAAARWSVTRPAVRKDKVDSSRDPARYAALRMAPGSGVRRRAPPARVGGSELETERVLQLAALGPRVLRVGDPEVRRRDRHVGVGPVDLVQQ